MNITTSLLKFGIVLCTIFFTTYTTDIVRQPIKVLNVNGCALKYKKDVPNKPDIFITTVIVPGVCHLQKHQQESTENYENFKIEYYRKEYEREYGDLEIGPIIPGTIQKMNITNYQGLTYDVRTKSLMYLNKPLYKHIPATLIRRRFNDSRIIQTFSWLYLLQNSFLGDEGMDDLAYDWRTKNMFINNAGGIAVKNLEKPWDTVDLVKGTSTIMSFAIHPNAGYLFFVEMARTDKDFKFTTSTDLYRGELTSKIYRTYLDGTNKRQIGPTIIQRDAFIANLVIDYYTDRLYWTIPPMNVIQSSKLDGTDVKNMTHRELFYGLAEDAARSISFDKKYVYYILKNRSVLRFDKETLKEDEDFEIVNEGKGLIAEIVVYDPESYKITTDHPCLINNGECKQYCLALPKDHGKPGPSRTCLNSNSRM